MELIRRDQILERVRTLSALPLTRQLGLMVGIAVSVALGIAVVFWSREPIYRPLYTNLSPQDASEIVAALQERGVDYRIDERGGSILVPADTMHATRIALASTGLPKGSGVGFELLDRQAPFGESEFMESARYQRVLEGELGRTIGSLADVQGVRVHLALPKRSVFLREREKPSASVLVNLYPGRTLEPAQVQAIMHLVSSSVPNLERGRVTVIDQGGRLLSPEEGSSGLEGSMAQLAFVRRTESAYARRVEEILAAIVGPDRVRAQVTADLDFTMVEATEERFGPEQQVLRSEQVAEQRSRGSTLQGGIPGALSNQPPAGGSLEPEGGAAAPQGNESSSRNATRNFEVDRTVRHVRSPTGVLRRLSVAVVIDDAAPPDEEGKPQPKPLSQGQIDDLTVLVKRAVGFNEERGDSVHVVSASFWNGTDGLAAAEAQPWGQAWQWSLVKQGVGALVLLLLVFAVLRPLMRGATQVGRQGQEQGPPALAGAVAGAVGGPALASPTELTADRVAVSQEAQAAVGRLAAPRDYEGQVARAQSLISEDPRLAAVLVKEWLASDE
ncbi:MAG: flagellar basal-body MS-ring/collar protein FliF [Chromatiaceae bacterium]